MHILIYSIVFKLLDAIQRFCCEYTWVQIGPLYIYITDTLWNGPLWYDTNLKVLGGS